MFKKFATILLFVLTLSACGSLGDEQIGVTNSALNYTATVTQPGNPGWSNQGWLWASGWDPLHADWPAHNWARWSPYSGSGVIGWRTNFCNHVSPVSRGTAYIYSGDSYTGNCTELTGTATTLVNGTIQGGFIFNSDWMQASGLYATWTDLNGIVNNVRVRSFKLAPHTHFVNCDAPFGIVGTCVTTDAVGELDVPAIGAGTIWPIAEIASIQLGFFF